MNDLLEERLRSLATALEVPDVAPDADLARGRRGLRRHRITVAGVAAAAVVAAGGIALALPGTGPRGDAQPANPSKSASTPALPAPDRAGAVAADLLSSDAFRVTTAGWDPVEGLTAPTDRQEPLRAYDVHLLGTDTTTGRTSTLTLRVAASRYDSQVECRVTCTPYTVDPSAAGRPGAQGWQVFQTQGDRTFAYPRPDGTVVTLTAHVLRTHPDLLDQQQIDAVLASGDLGLDGEPSPVSWPLPQVVDAIGTDVLGSDLDWQRHADPFYTAAAAARPGLGTVTWDAAPALFETANPCGEAGTAMRLPRYVHGTCDQLRTPDGDQVVVFTYGDDAGPFAEDRVYSYRGPNQVARVLVEVTGAQAAATEGEAVAMVTDPRWQQ